MSDERIDKLIKALSKNVEAQSLKEMQEKIKKASRRKILRQQLELLTEASRRNYDICPITEASEAMASINKELLKTEYIFLMGVVVALLGLPHLIKRVLVK